MWLHLFQLMTNFGDLGRIRGNDTLWSVTGYCRAALHWIFGQPRPDKEQLECEFEKITHAFDVWDKFDYSSAEGSYANP